MPTIPDISGNDKIPFWCRVSRPMEDWCKLWNDLDQRLPKSRVHRNGCDFKQNIYKVLPRIPGIPVNYKIPFQRTTASSPLEAVCQIGNDSDQWLHSSLMPKHACDFRSKQNIFKVVPWIPGIPRNYYIPFQITVSVPLKRCVKFETIPTNGYTILACKDMVVMLRKIYNVAPRIPGNYKIPFRTQLQVP